MYKENKQKHNSSVFKTCFWTQYFIRYFVACSTWLSSRKWHSNFSEDNCSSACQVVFILPSDLFYSVYTIHMPHVLFQEPAHDIREDTHLVPLKVASALPAIISILLYGASCFAFILHPESSDFKNLNQLMYITLLSCPISQNDMKTFHSNLTQKMGKK